MFKFRMALGILASVILILSSAAHSLLGWKQLEIELTNARVPPDLALGVKLGWRFGGIAMLVLGLITILHFSTRSAAAAVIGLA